MNEEKKQEIAERVIGKIAEQHCHRTFSYYTKEDLFQEVWSICLSKIDTFDEDCGDCELTYEKKLEHYLRSIVSNRLVNLFKKVTKSVVKPCLKCPHYNPDKEVFCGLYGEDTQSCDLFRSYSLSVSSRNDLMSNYEHRDDTETNHDVLNKLASDELINKIKVHLPEDAKYDFDCFISHQPLPKYKLVKLTKIVWKILHDLDIDLENLNA